MSPFSTPALAWCESLQVSCAAVSSLSFFSGFPLSLEEAGRKSLRRRCRCPSDPSSVCKRVDKATVSSGVRPVVSSLLRKMLLPGAGAGEGEGAQHATALETLLAVVKGRMMPPVFFFGELLQFQDGSESEQQGVEKEQGLDAKVEVLLQLLVATAKRPPSWEENPELKEDVSFLLAECLRCSSASCKRKALQVVSLFLFFSSFLPVFFEMC